MSGPFLALDGLSAVPVRQLISVYEGRRVSNPSYLLGCRALVTQVAVLVFFNRLKVFLSEVSEKQPCGMDHT